MILIKQGCSRKKGPLLLAAASYLCVTTMSLLTRKSVINYLEVEADRLLLLECADGGRSK